MTKYFKFFWLSKIKCLSLQNLTNTAMMKKNGFWYRVYDLYIDGFRHMKLGKTLWAVVLIKLFIIFVVLKIFFFPSFIGERTEKGGEADFVATELADRSAGKDVSN